MPALPDHEPFGFSIAVPASHKRVPALKAIYTVWHYQCLGLRDGACRLSSAILAIIPARGFSASGSAERRFGVRQVRIHPLRGSGREARPHPCGRMSSGSGTQSVMTGPSAPVRANARERLSRLRRTGASRNDALTYALGRTKTTVEETRVIAHRCLKALQH